MVDFIYYSILTKNPQDDKLHPADFPLIKYNSEQNIKGVRGGGGGVKKREREGGLGWKSNAAGALFNALIFRVLDFSLS